MNLLSSRWRRRVLFGALYFAEGAPIGFLWAALVTRMRDAGVPHEEIGRTLALIALPWACKFAWAPAVDALRTPRFSFRGWAVAAQVVMALGLLPLLWLDLREDLTWIVAGLVVHAVGAATQDVAIDGLAISCVPEAERGSLNGAMQTGMMLGRAAFGGGALVAGAHLPNESAPVLLLLAVLVATALLLWIGVRPGEAPPSAPASLRSVRRVVVALLSRRTTWWGLAFAVVAGAGYEAVGGMTGAYLIDAGASKGQAGWFQGVAKLAAMILGALGGGVLADRRGAARATRDALLILTGALLAFAALDAARSDLAFRLAALTVVYGAVGMFVASSYAMFMALADRSLAATQFSAWMGGTNLCESWAALAAGALIPAAGYGATFALLAFVGLTGVLLLPRLRPADAAR